MYASVSMWTDVSYLLSVYLFKYTLLHNLEALYSGVWLHVERHCYAGIV